MTSNERADAASNRWPCSLLVVSLSGLLIMGALAVGGCSDGEPDVHSETRTGGTSETVHSASSTSTTQRGTRGPILAGTTGSFEFTAYEPLKDRPLKVWYDAPSGDLTSVDVLVVMHGQQRNGETYRDDWIPYARSKRVLLIVPEFSEKFYPGPESYNVGNVVTEDGDPVPESRWSFSIIEPLFDYVRAGTGNHSDGYFLYGHSAGAQFVHRFMILVPNNRVKRAVSANAGWYTAPETDVDFPYGLRGSASTEVGLRRALASSLTILLGEDDVDTDSESLRSTPETDRQGPNRLARGHFFFEAGRQAAAALGSPFGWQLDTVSGAEHSNAEMAPAAAAILFK